MRYIDAEKLKAEIKRRIDAETEELKKAKHSQFTKLGKINALENLIPFIDSLQQDESQVDKMLRTQIWWEEEGWTMIPPDATIEGIDSLLKQVRKKLEQERPEVDCKDALMEWAKTKLADITECLKSKDDPVWWGQRNAFQQLVDKINSL